MGNKKGSIFQLLTNLAIIGLFVSVGLIVFGVMDVLKFNFAIMTLIAVIIIFCVCDLLLLPWLNNIERKKLKVLSWIFVGVTILCGILWVISALILISAIYGKTAMGRGALLFLQIALIMTIQFLVAINIASTIAKYKKSMIPFQVVYYVSLLFIDWFFTNLILCLQIDSKVKFNVGLVDILFNRVGITLLVLAFAYVLVSKAIIKSVDRKRAKNAMETITDADNNVKDKKDLGDNSTEDKLKRLKQLREQNLISQEEYEAKRKQIIDLM